MQGLQIAADAHGGLGLFAEVELPLGSMLPYWGIPRFISITDGDMFSSMTDRSLSLLHFVESSELLVLQGTLLCPTTYCNSSETPNAELVVGTPSEWATTLELVKRSNPFNNQPFVDMLLRIHVRLLKTIPAGTEILLQYDWESLPKGQGDVCPWDLTWNDSRNSL